MTAVSLACASCELLTSPTHNDSTWSQLRRSRFLNSHQNEQESSQSSGPVQPCLAKPLWLPEPFSPVRSSPPSHWASHSSPCRPGMDTAGQVQPQWQIQKPFLHPFAKVCLSAPCPRDLVQWQNLQSLDLAANPLHCDCQLAWLRDVLSAAGSLYSIYLPTKNICIWESQNYL